MPRPAALFIALALALVPACSGGGVERVPAERIFEQPPPGYTFQAVPGEDLASIASEILQAEGVVDFAARLLVDRDGVIQGVIQAVGQEPELAASPAHFDAFMAGIEADVGVEARPERVDGVDVRLLDRTATATSLAIWQEPGTNVFVIATAGNEAAALRVAAAMLSLSASR